MAKQSKNLQKVQDMLDGNFQTKIIVGEHSVGRDDKQRKVGDKWTDVDGIPWEQKDGYKVKGRLATSDVTHHSWDKKCSMCETLILKPWDKDTYKADGRCYHCQLNYELDKINNEKVFDKSVANALANDNIDTTNVKLKNN